MLSLWFRAMPSVSHNINREWNQYQVEKVYNQLQSLRYQQSNINKSKVFCMLHRTAKVINKYVIYEWPKDQNLRDSIKHFKFYRVKYLGSYKVLLCRVGSSVWKHLFPCQVSRLHFSMLSVVYNCQTFTWGGREGSLVSASVLFTCFWNYPLCLGL
jgi:hypothetical protein